MNPTSMTETGLMDEISPQRQTRGMSYASNTGQRDESFLNKKGQVREMNHILGREINHATWSNKYVIWCNEICFNDKGRLDA